MRINRLVQSFALGALLFAGTAHAQVLGLNWNPRTGDVWVDARLADINRYGGAYREPFIDEMVRYHGAPRDFVTDLLVNQRWSPGDVYYACTIAQAIGRPCRYVADQWQEHRGQGWGVVAQRLGIKPGSAEFHRLKKGFVPTYDRWARPIELDAELARAYPNRGKSKQATGSSKRVDGKGTGRPAAHTKARAAPSAKAKTTPAGKASGKGNGKDGGKGGGNGNGNGKGNGKS